MTESKESVRIDCAVVDPFGIALVDAIDGSGGGDVEGRSVGEGVGEGSNGDVVLTNCSIAAAPPLSPDERYGELEATDPE